MIKLLLVDDELEFLDATERALARRGFSVARASDGRVALDMLVEQRFDVAVLDVRMPGLDGVELFHRVKRLQPRLPMVLLTGHGNVQQAFDTSRDGVFEYLAKPCDLDKLASVLRRAVEATEAPAPRLGPAADDEQVRLLFVDDELDLLDSLCTAMARRGVMVDTAPSAAEALRLLDERIYDVAIVDVRMAGMDGLALLERVKQSQPLLEVIMLTGHPSMGEAVEAMKDGAFDFLTKPQPVDVLVERVRAAFRSRQARAAEQQRHRLAELLAGTSD